MAVNSNVEESEELTVLNLQSNQQHAIAKKFISDAEELAVTKQNNNNEGEVDAVVIENESIRRRLLKDRSNEWLEQVVKADDDDQEKEE